MTKMRLNRATIFNVATLIALIVSAIFASPASAWNDAQCQAWWDQYGEVHPDCKKCPDGSVIAKRSHCSEPSKTPDPEPPHPTVHPTEPPVTETPVPTHTPAPTETPVPLTEPPSGRIDKCENIEFDQSSVPDGMYKDGKNCYPIAPAIGGGGNSCEDEEYVIFIESQSGIEETVLVRYNVRRENGKPVEFYNRLELSKDLEPATYEGASFEPKECGKISFFRDGQLWIINRDGTDAKLVFPQNGPTTKGYNTSWSLDGFIYFNTEELWRVMPDGSEMKLVGNIPAENVDTSPDGTALAVTFEGSVSLVNPGSPESAESANIANCHPNWIPTQVGVDCGPQTLVVNTLETETTASYYTEVLRDPAGTDVAIVVTSSGNGWLDSDINIVAIGMLAVGGEGMEYTNESETQFDWYVPEPIQPEPVELTSETNGGGIAQPEPGGEPTIVPNTGADACPADFDVDYDGFSIVDFFALNGEDSSKENRTEIGTLCGVNNVGTTQGNLDLIAALQAAATP